MLKNENIICISSIDWDFVWQGHQEIMSTFARQGNRVLFIENTGVRRPTLKDASRLKKRIVSWLKSVKGFRKETDNLFVYSPLVLPFPYSRLSRWINKRLFLEPLKRWMKAADFHDVIIWTFLPTGTALDVINELSAKLVVYYAIADFMALTDNPKQLSRTEEQVMKKCDLIFAQGRIIEERCKKHNDRVTIFPFGVNDRLFEEYRNAPVKQAPADMAKAAHPVIGYIGGIHKHIDAALLKNMASRHPEWTIVLVGPLQMDVAELRQMPNIAFVGQKSFSELPAYISQFDVCIIPYLISEYTRTVYPTKLNEYHVMGKPVVSTALPEVRAYNDAYGGVVSIAETHSEFIDLTEKALAEKDASGVSRRIAAAKKNSWAERVEAMSDLMERRIEENRSQAPTQWQERFLRLYARTKRTTVKVVVAVVLVWAIVFHTPLVWFLARPLLVPAALHHADAIAVFAGGVGESGKAGQGYEERVGYAVELYKKEYAPRLIVSSGYKYFFDETFLMKALAVSLGVPAHNISIEDTARNTYENVIFTRNIMAKERWKSVLIVSSPYNMARVAGVVAKNAPGIEVFYAPLPHSSFYAHARKNFFDSHITFGQLRAIVHEYLGILYYRWKGWI